MPDCGCILQVRKKYYKPETHLGRKGQTLFIRNHGFHLFYQAPIIGQIVVLAENRKQKATFILKIVVRWSHPQVVCHLYGKASEAHRELLSLPSPPKGSSGGREGISGRIVPQEV